MRNIKLSIEYDGTGYAGWQQQDNAVTVQEKVKAVIEKIVNETIKLHGSGRTDAGVHALGQIANFKTTSTIPSPNLILAINALLPKDIAINDACDVDDDFHARFSAKWKVYKYTVFNSKLRPALNRDFCYVFNIPLNMDALLKGADVLTGDNDFSAFKTGALPGEDNVRCLKRLDIEKSGQYVCFILEGNGFLRNMVRRIVGVLLEIGRGKISVEGLKGILESKNPTNGRYTNSPAKGLCLMEVKY